MGGQRSCPHPVKCYRLCLRTSALCSPIPTRVCVCVCVCVFACVCCRLLTCVVAPSEMETNRNKVQRKPVRVIAAVCRDMGIGKDGKLPWHLPCEFQYFLNTVTRVSRPGKMNMMVWGKLCWYSQPETMFPLTNVLHVVLSTTLRAVPERAHFLGEDFECAVRLASEAPLADVIETIWVVGGMRVYKEALTHPWCDLVYLTDIMADFDCDVFFPDFDRQLFKVQERFPEVPADIQEENGIKYKFQVFKKSISDAI